MADTHRHDHDATLISATDTPALLSRVSWGAIFAGTVIAVGVLILLGMLGTAIGFRAIDPQQGAAFDGVGLGAGIWWIVTSIIALGIGGYVAGRLSGIPDKNAATAHGASVWGLLTIVMLWFATSTVGAAVNTATSAVAGAANAIGSVADTAARALPEDAVPQDVSQQQVESRVEDAVGSVRNEIEGVDTQDLRQDAGRTAESALDALSSASWYAFFASLLSLVAAIIAAGAGAPHRTFVTARDHVDVNRRDAT